MKVVERFEMNSMTEMDIRYFKNIFKKSSIKDEQKSVVPKCNLFYFFMENEDERVASQNLDC